MGSSGPLWTLSSMRSAVIPRIRSITTVLLTVQRSVSKHASWHRTEPCHIRAVRSGDEGLVTIAHRPSEPMIHVLVLAGHMATPPRSFKLIDVPLASHYHGRSRRVKPMPLRG